MKAYQIESPTGLDALKVIELPQPNPGPGEILVKIHACSMNYRDLSMPRGGYLRNNKMPLVPLSDGAGEVIEVGPGVAEFKTGDRVAGCFFQDWVSGEVSERQMLSALGGAIDGVLAEYVVLKERGAVHMPTHLDYAQAACLPCAALTAWQALTLAGLQAGQTILTLGTGGVSIFALQLAKAFGARVIITSSSNTKLERAKQLGADEVINYKEHPDWHKQVRELTGGVGVDNVIELGGAGTLERSLQAVRVSGTVSLIGVLTGQPEQNPSPMPVLFNRIRLQGIYVGSRDMFQAMNRAIEVNRIEPVIDRTFGFGEVRAAYEYLRSGKHFGKLVVTLT
jgi:NADPH:quinone reductase-like Zn-dependent oxidoreductase